MARRFRIHALVAGRNLDVLCSQILEFRPNVVVVADDDTLDALHKRLAEWLYREARWPELAAGAEARVAAATALRGGFRDVGDRRRGRAGGDLRGHSSKGSGSDWLIKRYWSRAASLVMQAVREHGTELIPVDSEHNGAHQCFRAGTRGEVTRLLLTASGGPFRDTPQGERCGK